MPANPDTEPPADDWYCSCGQGNNGKYCTECGTIKPGTEPETQAPVDTTGWGKWTTYRSAANYPDPTDPNADPDEVYPPEAGYSYTADGFTVIQPNWTGVAPWVTVSTREAVNLKNGLYLEFRIDDYSYGWNAQGENVDHWISVSLNTGKVEADGSVTGKVCPPETRFGGGWNALLRSKGFGSGDIIGCQTYPDDTVNGVTGSFLAPEYYSNVAVPTDDQGREVYTLEVTWNGYAYVIKINGRVISDAYVDNGKSSALLQSLSPDGEFFVGITMMDTVTGGSAGLTITKFGTSAANATKPAGIDSKTPEKNYVVVAPIADPSTVPVNTPAILWSPETYNLKSGQNVTFSTLGDNTWQGTASSESAYFTLSAKNAWSYDAEDFPVFGIMIRNFRVDDLKLWYSTGDITSATEGYSYRFTVYDGDFYEIGDDEYIFIPVNLADLTEGRIHAMRVDFTMPDGVTREFGVCFAGMFRSEDEANAYAESWIADYEPAPELPDGAWGCVCGQVNMGKYCSECGRMKPPAEVVTETVVLSPFIGVGNSQTGFLIHNTGGAQKCGMRFDLGDSSLRQFTVNQMATFEDITEGCINTWKVEIFRWNGDYATTTSGTALCTIFGINHQNMSDFVVDIPAGLVITDEILIEITRTDGTSSFTGWIGGNTAAGYVSYLDSVSAQPFAASIVVALPAEEANED